MHIFKFNDQSAHEPKLEKVNWNSLIKKVGRKIGHSYLNITIFVYVRKKLDGRTKVSSFKLY